MGAFIQCALAPLKDKILPPFRRYPAPPKELVPSLESKILWLGKAFGLEPSLLLMDEPSAALCMWSSNSTCLKQTMIMGRQQLCSKAKCSLDNGTISYKLNPGRDSFSGWFRAY